MATTDEISTDTQPTPEAIALATAILQRRAEHAAKKAERAARAVPCATYMGQPIPLGSPVYGFVGYPTSIKQLGVVAGVCLTDSTKVVLAAQWSKGAPLHRYENAREDKRHTLGRGAWPAWSLAHEELRRQAAYAVTDLERRLNDARVRLAVVDAMVAPAATAEPVK